MATFDVEYNGDVKAEMFQVVTLTKKTVKKVDVYSFTYKDLARSTPPRRLRRKTPRRKKKKNRPAARTTG